MTRFKGHSSDTYRMKAKPIKEGFKFFAIACSQSTFIYHLLPYSRNNTRVGIIKTVQKLVNTLPNPQRRNYLVAMDNYFTYDKVVDYCVDIGLHVVGTAKAKRGWPPECLRNVNEGRFNFLHHTSSKSGKFKILRWVDNGVVLMVTTCHKPTDTVEVLRKRPRVTHVNRDNVRHVWGSEWCRKIHIPLAVHHYNNNKTGVDAGDQLIAVYSNELRMRRTWMPTWKHIMNVSRANSFSHHRRYCGNLAWTSKKFMLQWIRCFLLRAKGADAYNTRDNFRKTAPKPAKKRTRMSHTCPTLPAERFDKSLVHVAVVDCPQRGCVFCRFKRAWKKRIGTPKSDLPDVSRPKRQCLGCRVNLCAKCFYLYHTFPAPDYEKMTFPQES